MKRLTAIELPRLRRIGREFTIAAGRKGEFCESHFEDVWAVLIESGRGVIFYEEDESGDLAGVFGAVFSPDMFSGNLVAAETFWFVRPESRGKSLSLRLLKAFEDEAAARKCQQLLMVCLTACDPETVGGILMRHGYSALEIIHMKEI